MAVPFNLSSPAYAVAGAGELAVQTLRSVPTRVTALRPALDPADAVSRAMSLRARARSVYGDLAVRGEHVVRRVRGQAAER
jgi:hypothetical protein